jgi:glycosyltransferase involved in cell wall biosynthesis|tara:strand:+ start:1263 stop:1943 length:681 start_codon:yes stop_codon:yes gene_type:complete
MLNDLSIVVLAKEEYLNILKIIPKLKKYSKDIILIDGNSNDGTKEFCKKQKVRFYLDNGKGKGAAQRLGASKAKKKNIIFIDGDGAHDLKDITKINFLLKKFDLVTCSRQTGGSFDLNFSEGFLSAIRASGVIFLVVMTNKLFKKNFTDVLYSLKGISRKNFLNLKTKSNGFSIELDILISSIVKNYKIYELPSRENSRKYGKSKLSTIVGVYFIYYILMRFIKKN